MKIKFENLGALKVGEIELADLTVICGENNTGKTYVTYLVYCLLNSWRSLVDIDLKTAFVDLGSNGIATVDLQEIIVQSWDDLCKITVKKFEENFPEMIASKSELFDYLKLEIDLPLGNAWLNKDFVNEIRSNNGKLLVTLTKNSASGAVELAAPEAEERKQFHNISLGAFIKERLLSLFFEDLIPNVFIASTERTGATTFKKQLNLATSNLIDLLGQAHKEGAESITPNKVFATFKVFATLYGRPEYALPVRHNVQFLNQLPNINTEDGELFKSEGKLLKKFEAIVGGTYVTNKEGITSFQPKGSKVKLGLGEVSSSVRSLLIVWYWIKYFAKKGDLLMLDEPELNLHPVNQRRLARFLVSLVNCGVKVFITTHSDYIVKEFNTLIMLNQKSEKLDKIRQELIDYDNDDKLDYQQIALYMTRWEKVAGKKINVLKAADINATLGIDVVSFDETIDDMNALQEKIYYAMH